jgi:hypothetical protein
MITISKQDDSKVMVKQLGIDGTPGLKRARPTVATSRYIDVMKLLAETVHTHPWTFSTVDAVARSVVGSGWKIIPKEGYESLATKRGKRTVDNFLNYSRKTRGNIRDFIGFPSKLSQTVSSYRLFGQASWNIIKEGNRCVGFDVLSGYTVPNIDEHGNFLEPAFIHYPWDGSKEVEFGIGDIVYFFNPGVTGRILGESPYESLIDVSLPADFYAALSYRSVLENVNAPYNGVWVVDPTVSDEDFDLFVNLLQERYTGAENFGRNPLVIRGMAEFKETESNRKDSAPYIDGRQFSREEMFGVTGVAGNKLGLSSDFNKANIRETRREFHESVLRPLFDVIEGVINDQVISGVLGVDFWEFKFNRPDITTALEQASIDMRYLQFGVFSPNEIRAQHGVAPRKDGDEYYIPGTTTGDVTRPKSGQQGKQEIEGEENPDTSTNPLPVERPPRDEASISNSADNDKRALIIKEIKNWRKITLEGMDGKRPHKKFIPESIPSHVALNINELLESSYGDFDDVKKIFNAAILLYEENDDVQQNA